MAKSLATQSFTITIQPSHHERARIIWVNASKAPGGSVLIMKHLLVRTIIVAISLALLLGCTSRAKSNLAFHSSSPILPTCAKDRHLRISSQRADSLYFLNTGSGWAILGSGLYQTVNGGKTWELLNHNEIGLQAVIF